MTTWTKGDAEPGAGEGRGAGLDIETVDRICHELRRPIATIDAYAELLADGISGPLTGTQREHVGILKAGVRKLDSSIARLYEAFEVLGGGVRPEWGEHELERLLYDVAEAQEKRCAELGVRFSVVTEGPLHHPRVDGKKLRLALGRAVDALLAAEEGVEELTLRLRGTPEGARIEVASQGPGARPDVRDVPVGGADLCLAVVHGLADALGGRASTEARPPLGRAVVLDLPYTEGGGDDHGDRTTTSGSRGDFEGDMP